MQGVRYTDEFKRDTVSQVVDRGHSVMDVSERLGISSKSLYSWIRKLSKHHKAAASERKQSAEIRRLKAELQRVTEERDILKNSVLAKASRPAKHRLRCLPTHPRTAKAASLRTSL